MVVPQHDTMENVGRKPLIQIEVTKVNNVIWETLKYFAVALEDDEDDLDDDKFYTPLTSPSEFIFEETEFCI